MKTIGRVARAIDQSSAGGTPKEYGGLREEIRRGHEIAARLAARKGHFMPASLLQSQFAALERPTADENAITVAISGSVDDVVARTIDALRA